MPELPEVETTRRGIEPLLRGRQVEAVRVHDRRLRWPVSPRLARELAGHSIVAVERRGKYLLLRSPGGTLILHLGMSGSLRVCDAGAPRGPHDHLELLLAGGRALRLRDPRRFGAAIWTTADPLRHPRLRDLGPEPLDPAAFDPAWLYRRTRGRRTPVKTAIMDARIVVGVGNIYASESLHLAGIRPSTPAGRLSRPRCARLVDAIREVLEAAIAAGGTTLRDFSDAAGRPGYFARSLRVYGRGGEPCPACGGPVRRTLIAQRATYHCPGCQR